MNVLVVADGHYFQTPDGTIYAESVYDYSFYKRYLLAFDHVYAAVRLDQLKEIPCRMKKASGEGITFLPLPAYRGPKEYLQKYNAILKCVSKYCQEYDCAIFRIPAATSNIFCKKYIKTGKPFAVEVVVDPWENFGPGATGNKVMLYVVRRTWTDLVKKMCWNANGASYVTERYLQEKYPPRAYIDTSGKYFTESYSSVELPDETFSVPRQWSDEQGEFWISHVANSFTGYGKGHITLMDAVRIVREKGYNVNIKFVGDGPKRLEFEEYAKKIGIRDYVVFTGRLANGLEVRNVIHDSDIFILPTFAEGLPRVLLEAMAEGIPCLSSPTCGIPEILSKEFLYEFGDAEGFAEGIVSFITDVNKMNKESINNLNTAKKYASTVLNQKRKEFYSKLRTVTEMQLQEIQYDSIRRL